MKGYNGKIMRVDLSVRRCTEEIPPEEFYRTYLGGRGFIAHEVLTGVKKGTDPLGPENRLVFALGPFTGHQITGSGRNSVGAKSPLTNGLGESEVGGFWGAELRRAGFDAIVVDGAAEGPVYLAVHNGQCEIRDARAIWGLETGETEQRIRDDLGEKRVRVAAIGPGGERLVRYASIHNDVTHVAGRTGMGAVMGSKKLKAVAVKGDKTPEVADREKLHELSRWMHTNYKVKTRFWEYGTGSIMDYYEAAGNLPIRNFLGGTFPAVDSISAQALFKKGYVLRMDNCYGCPVRCKKRVRINGTWNADPLYGGPEYETLAAFGSNCGIDNLEAIVKANELCGRYGIDTISTGLCISFAMECFEKGLLTAADTDGLDLRFGNTEAMLEMVERIARRQGLGDMLAEGTRRAARTIGKGAGEFAMESKGLELVMHEPRYRKGMGLHFSIHFAGPDHCTGILDDLIGKYWDDWQEYGSPENIPIPELSPRKARFLYEVGLWKQLVNHLGVCFFLPWSGQQIVEIMEAVTGWETSAGSLLEAAERGMALGRIFNMREGLTAKDDTLPKRFFEAPSEGPLKDVSVDQADMAAAQQAYYRLVGWDDDGIPTGARLAELGIMWAQPYLETGE